MISPPGATTGGAHLVHGVDVDAVATAVRACPGVDDLDGGPVNERLATYLPGRTIDGLKVTEHALTVQVRGRWDTPVVDLAAEVRFALAALAHGRRVDIIVADLTPAPGYEPEPQPAPSEPAARQADIAGTPPTPASVLPEARDETVAPVAEPVIVERTVIVTEKVVHDPAAAESASTPPEPVQIAEPTGTARPARPVVDPHRGCS